MREHLNAVSLKNVRVADDFWSARQRLMTDATVPYMERILRDEVPGAEKSHAIANFRIAAGEEGGEFYGMVFQDSDVYKWLEAAAYSLCVKPDAALEARADEIIGLIARAQQPDGYLNTYFTLREPGRRWTNLLECHELYCAGHLMEAAAAYFEVTGKAALLGVAERLADHICAQFGGEEQMGVPGHQEVEIGLMRLFRATGNAAYRGMALRFLDRRGQDPDFFLKHTPAHPGVRYGGYDIDPADTRYNQSDLPVREQAVARGHAVRQLYMLTAMADAANATGDAQLRAACERLWDNITDRQMYLTGAVGATAHRESFTVDWDLPNDIAYGETCASVALSFFARQMLLGERPDGRYADVLERVLYNGALAGMQLDGRRYFYVNPLEVDPAVSGHVPGHEHVLVERPQWHACACCPPNLARLIASLGGYLWSEGENTVYSHLFIGNEAHLRHADIALTTFYPWEGSARFTVMPRGAEPFRLAVRIPAYAEALTISINGKPAPDAREDGYLIVERAWAAGDCLEIAFPLSPRRVYADPRVRADAGCVALMRGPLVYCFEGVDNGEPLSALRLPRSARVAALPYDENLLGGVVPLAATGLREEVLPALYAEAPPRAVEARLLAIPYYAWSNRGANQMRVWLRESEDI